jgi:glycosyltransferase involved in cell wall biosynthesis
LYRQIERRYLASVDGFVCNSADTWREVARTLPQPLAGAGEGNRQSKPHVVAPPAGDRWQIALSEAQIEARAHAPGPLRVLFVGNLIPRKGLHTLLEALACAALPSGAVSLTVVGNPQVDPAYSATVHRQAEQYKARVAFRGSLADAEMENEFASHQVLAVPSSYEGFGIVYLEGMGFGLPAIAGAAGGAGEIVRDGENGFLLGDEFIAGGDAADSPPARLAACLARLSADRDLLARMSLAALDTYLAHPTWEDTGSVIHGFLSDLTKGVLPARHAGSLRPGSVLS